MSLRYKGAILSATPPNPTSSSASGEWTLQQQFQAQSAGNWPFGGPFPYIEDVFSTWLYTGNGSTQTITNGIDLSGKGGLVWTKDRSTTGSHWLIDTNRGRDYVLISNGTNDQLVGFNGNLASFNSNGYSLTTGYPNNSPTNYVSWTFRKQAKFFDVVTYTGNGANRTIAHSLGSVPGCIIVKRTDNSGAWAVYHRSLANTEYMVLNTTAAKATGATYWNSTTPTSTVFSLGTATDVNANGGTYVAYLFAHDAGGFGLTGTDNVISCGSFTTDGSGNATVNLGYEPQFLIHKATAGTESWLMLDTMRGWNMSTADRDLFCNAPSAEASGNYGDPTATGFTAAGLTASRTYIYIAIRRGPMKTPTSGTSVYDTNIWAGNDANPQNISFSNTQNFVLDASIFKTRTTVNSAASIARLVGGAYLETANTNAEVASSINFGAPSASTYGNTQVSSPFNASSRGNNVSYAFRRAPGFFDVVCYTGVGNGVAIPHNLGVAPELMIVKNRGRAGYPFVVWSNQTGTSAAALNSTGTFGYANMSPTVTASSITYGGIGYEFDFGSSDTYVAYLFASCPGVSKVGSYTGTGALQTINCGFTGGARFVLIKRTDSTGDWWVYDSARGISSGNDPYLFLNSTAAEVTGTNYVDTDSTGFKVTAAAPAGLNANGGTYIFLAIA